MVSPIATLAPTPTNAPTGNLAPRVPSGWDAPLVAANKLGTRRNTEVSVDDVTLISWAIGNDGAHAVNDSFYVDLYFDGVVVERWISNGMSTNVFASITEWTGLGDVARLTPGTHRLKLVVDSTRLIVETDETDNTFEGEFTWGGDPPVLPTISRLPDLAPFTPEDWSGPIVATSYVSDTVDGPLSVAVPAYIGYGAENRGLSSTPEDVWVHLYLDDVLVDVGSWGGLLVDEQLGRQGWSKLYAMTNVSPGEHTLRLVVDPSDLIPESDEKNNVVERVYKWEAGAVPGKPPPTVEPAPTPPAPLTLPNLVPGWMYGSDGPIIVSCEAGSLLDSHLVVGQTVFIDVVVANQSAIGAKTLFTADLYFDGSRIKSFEFSGTTRGEALRFFEDWSGLTQDVSVTPGPHTLRLVIDPSDAVVESDESDNVFEKTLEWDTFEAPAPPPVEYTVSQLLEMVGTLNALIDDKTPVVSAESDTLSVDVSRVADAGYFLLTGRSILDERVEIFLATHAGYLDWIEEHFGIKFAISDAADYGAVLAARERIKADALGFKTRRQGKVAVIVDAERPFADVLDSLVHELGHMRQDIINPAQSETVEPSFALNAIQEAGAQQFERAFWLALEDLTGLSLLAYPDLPGFRAQIDRRLDKWLQRISSDEHALGHLLQWLAVFNDPQLSHLRAELAGGEGLTTASALELYNYLVDLPPETATAYVNSRLSALPTHREAIAAESRERLVQGLHPDLEASPALRVPGLLSP